MREICITIQMQCGEQAGGWMWPGANLEPCGQSWAMSSSLSWPFLVPGSQILQIPRVQISTGGKYTCVALNAAGRDEKLFLLRVYGEQRLPSLVCLMHCGPTSSPSAFLVPSDQWYRSCNLAAEHVMPHMGLQLRPRLLWRPICLCLMQASSVLEVASVLVRLLDSTFPGQAFTKYYDCTHSYS